jgi:hypothetical protein
MSTGNLFGGGGWDLGPLLAYQGKPGCADVECTRVMHRREDGSWAGGECVGWHCSRCDAPCSPMGHRCARDN